MDHKDFIDVPTILIGSLLTSGSAEMQENVVAMIQSLLDPEISQLPLPGWMIMNMPLFIHKIVPIRI